MRILGVDESVAMKILGQKTPSIFRRYNIVDRRDIREAVKRLHEKQKQQNQFDHSLAIVQPHGQSSEEGIKVEVAMAQ